MFIKNLIEKVVTYYRVQKARDALSLMDDRMLSDIGISRSDIDFVIASKEARHYS